MITQAHRLFSEVFVAILIPTIYLVIAIFTIGHYGLGMDEPAHFRRGQAYVHFFFTGQKTYDSISKAARRSIYQNDNENGIFYIDTPSNQSHPPLNDTLAALGNYIFYQKLGWFDDIDAHHLFSIFTMFFLLVVIYWYTRITTGIFAAIVATVAALLYPILLAESHFNVKDPPEVFFITLTVVCLYMVLAKKKKRYVYLSAIAGGVGLATKFTMLFVPGILLPWLIIRRADVIGIVKRFRRALLLYPIIILVIFFGTNPNLWTDTGFRLSEMVRFYLDVGTTTTGTAVYQSKYVLAGLNTYPLLAVLYSTPLVTLCLLFFGIIWVIRTFRHDDMKLGVLLISWLLFPILRVSVPGSSIYGGIRHIYEYIPAMAILVGIGANHIVTLLHGYIATLMKRLRNKQFNNLPAGKAGRTMKQLAIVLKIMILLMFLPITFKMIQLHPNENVYFNPLIGGLKGANEKRFPNAGASLGNTYQQGVAWVNAHAEKGACVSTPIAHQGNVPETKLRQDLRYDSTCQSNIERLGEYAMEMVYPDYFNNWYAYAYYETYLLPVYVVSVEGVPIFKVFQNDRAHSIPKFINVASIEAKNVTASSSSIDIELPREVVLNKLQLTYAVPSGCSPVKDGYVETSKDRIEWKRETDNISISHGRRSYNPNDFTIERLFPAVAARYIHIASDVPPLCSLIPRSVQIYYHPDAV